MWHGNGEMRRDADNDDDNADNERRRPKGGGKNETVTTCSLNHMKCRHWVATAVTGWQLLYDLRPSLPPWAPNQPDIFFLPLWFICLSPRVCRSVFHSLPREWAFSFLFSSPWIKWPTMTSRGSAPDVLSDVPSVNPEECRRSSVETHFKLTTEMRFRGTIDLMTVLISFFFTSHGDQNSTNKQTAQVHNNGE